MSRIYAAGVKATAIANLKADLAGFISFNADGQKVVDTNGLKAYLQTQLNLVVSGGEYVAPGTALSAAAAIKSVNTDNLVATFANSIGPQAWSGKPGWPTQASVLTGPQVVSAIKAAFASIAVLVDALSAYYKTTSYTIIDGWAKQMVNDFYSTQGVDGAVPAGVTILTESRVVVYTHVTDRGEESAPSPASALITLDQNDTATYTANAIPTGRNIATIRWYRSNSGNVGSDFQFVADVAYTSLTYADSKKPTELGESCPTTTWTEPPADFRGIVAGPNGAIAGFTGNRLCPSENFVPYAYPREYEKTTGWPIVGLGVFGGTYVVLTLGNPWYVTGADSSTLDSREIKCGHSCVARRSIASDASGVYFASPRGICRADASGVRLITGEDGYNLFDLDDWAALVPSTIIATVHAGAYLFQANPGTAQLYALDLATGKLVKLDSTASALYVDILADRVYYATGTTIKALFGDTTKRSGTWKSKLAKLESWGNPGWIQVDSDFSASVQVKIWRDGVLTDTKTVTTKKPVRISSKRGVEFEIQVASAARVTSVTLASTAADLRTV